MKKYLFFLAIFLIPIGTAYADTYTSNNPTEDGSLYDADNDNNCEAVPASVTFGDPDSITGRRGSAEVTDCARHYAEFDITSIPDGSQVVKVVFVFEVSSITTPLLNCDYIGMAAQPTANTDATNWANIGSGTVLNSNNPSCKTAGNNVYIDLGAAGNNYIESMLAGNWAAIGIKQNGDVGAIDATERYVAICPEESACTPDPTLRITYYDFAQDEVTTLIATDIRPTGADLSWTQPALNGATFHSYQVNYTTPWSSNVASVVNNNTTPTSLSVSGLTGSTPYSFRVGIRATNGFLNWTGNVLNVTTDMDPTTSFSTGTFSINFTGTDVRTIKYARTDINSTDLWLNVTADTDFQLACNFHYKFAAINRTYTNIANTSINADEDMATFRFNDVDNEIIDVLCWDQYTNESARYLITQTAFPFLEQIENFRNGTYGTMGQFGALDFISMIAVIASMIGFNRVNETVGIIFGLFMLGGLSVLSNGEIISWASTFTVGFAVLIMWAIGTTRKD